MMDGSFNRILTLLRRERGITQKEAAANLGVSQALLSHYEKGIRECGLDFVVRAADFYGVSCDYLLGRSPDRSGLTLMVDDIPESDDKNDARFRGSIIPILNKKLIANSLNVLFDMLQRCSHKELTIEVSNYLMLSVYKMFRKLFGANQKNQQNMFSVKPRLYSRYASAQMMKDEANIDAILSKDGLDGVEPVKNIENLQLTTEKLSEEYPLYAASLLNLIQLSERSIEDEKK